MVGVEVPAPAIINTHVVTFTVPGDPVSHARPRFSRRNGRVFTERATTEYKDMVALLVKSKVRTSREKYIAYGVEAHFYRSDRQRVDVDNLLKSILDGVTRSGLWADDSQVREAHAYVVLADPKPRAEVSIWETGPIDHPLCPMCLEPKKRRQASDHPGRICGKCFKKEARAGRTGIVRYHLSKRKQAPEIPPCSILP